MKRSESKIVEDLSERGYDKHEDSYDYLLKISIRFFTKEKIDELEKSIRELKKKMSNVFNFDGKEYSTESLNESAKAILNSLKSVDSKLNEKKNLIAIFTKAKNAYISDLKSEMLSTKAGFDFSD